MKKLQILVLALFAVSALGAVLVTSASAETAAKWLANGLDIPVGTNLATETGGNILLEDTKTIIGKAAVLCSGILDGTVTAGGVDLVEKALNLAKEELGVPLTGLPLLGTGGGPDCVAESPVTGCLEGTAASPIEVWVENLPWPTLLLAVGTGFANLVELAAYELLCLVNFLGSTINAEDLCEAADTVFEVKNELDAEIPAGAQGLPFANCTSGGTETGVNQADELTPITLNNGQLLTVSP